MASSHGLTLADKSKVECIICQDLFSEKDMETRKCGHTTCRCCDSEWRQRSSIVLLKTDICDATGVKKQIKQYHIQSTCPMCRGKDTFADFEHRSKESLAAELSIALGMIHRRKIYKLEASRPTTLTQWTQRRGPMQSPAPSVQVPVIHEIDDLSRQIIQQMIADGQIEPGLMPPAPVVIPVQEPPAPVVIPVQEPPAPVVIPVQAQVIRIVPLHPRLVLIDDPVPVVQEVEPYHNYGLFQHAAHRQPRNDICINRQLNRGCYTEKTKMKCSRCDRVLCRSCRDNCPVCNH